jgi:hypothetical protein
MVSPGQNPWHGLQNCPVYVCENGTGVTEWPLNKATFDHVDGNAWSLCGWQPGVTVNPPGTVHRVQDCSSGAQPGWKETSNYRYMYSDACFCKIPRYCCGTRWHSFALACIILNLLARFTSVLLNWNCRSSEDLEAGLFRYPLALLSPSQFAGLQVVAYSYFQRIQNCNVQVVVHVTAEYWHK